MILYSKKFEIFILVLLVTSFFILPCQAAGKDAKSMFGDSAKTTGNASGYVGSGAPFAGKDALQIVSILINILLSLVGVLFLILTIYGGFVWMNARGNEKEVERAKDIIRNSIIGLVLVLGAYAVTSFIGSLYK